MADNSNIIKTITVNDVTCDVAAKYDVDGNVISTTYLNKNTDGIMNGSLTVNNDTLFGHADGTSEHNFRGEIYTSYAINLNGGDVTLNGNDDNTRLTVNNNEVAHLSDLKDYLPTTGGEIAGDIKLADGSADILTNRNKIFLGKDETSYIRGASTAYVPEFINNNGSDFDNRIIMGNDHTQKFTYQFPKANGTVALRSDLTERIPCTLAQASNNSYIINKAGLYAITLESVSDTPKNRLMTMLSVEDITLNVKTYYMPSMYDEYYVKYDSSTKQVTCSMNDKYSIVSIRFVVDYE